MPTTMAQRPPVIPAQPFVHAGGPRPAVSSPRPA
jgi:hypothetical protein